MGAQRAFFRCKNERQQAIKENRRTSVTTMPQMPGSATSSVTLGESMASIYLPSEQWLAFPGDGCVQWIRMEIGHDGIY